jgi:hypothetical protein
MAVRMKVSAWMGYISHILSRYWDKIRIPMRRASQL